MNKWNLVAKIAGGLTAGLVTYNAHKTGKNVAAENVKIRAANRVTYDYINSRRLEDRSTVTNNLKNWYFRKKANWSLPDKINGLCGYCKGGFKQLTDDIVPALLATGALFGKGMSKYFGIGLLIYGIKYILTDVIDIGRVNQLK